jgi:adenylate cyclase
VTTVVFADIVGSTGMFERLGDATAGRIVTQLTGALAKIFEQHQGRVVKLLGDGLLVVFAREEQALAACIAIQEDLLRNPVRPGGTGRPVQMQIGIESGDVVEIQGDCYGDAVNSAARLADLAGAEQIFTTLRVRDAVPPHQQQMMRSLGAMYLRGKAEVTQVYRVEWQPEPDAEATVMGASVSAREMGLTRLEINLAGQTRSVGPFGDPVRLGRSSTADLSVNDARVSRLHATVEWRGAHFVLTDVSSFGTWVYFGNQPEPVVLRRTECVLVGQGQIALGCDRTVEDAPVAAFVITS